MEARGRPRQHPRQPVGAPGEHERRKARQRPEGVGRLDGDFAVALWHGERRGLVRARDFIGVGPLAWTWRPGAWLAYTSLPKGLDRSSTTLIAARPMRRRGGRVRVLSMTARQALGAPERDERPLIEAVLAQEPDLDPVLVHDHVPRPGERQDPDRPGLALDGPEHAMAAAFGADRILRGVGVPAPR
ncbi:hypothetical protein [Methylobacterium nonmethylotrophicum]|uniref:hypothetical protein n=1 Tax=Methylobacterium nonmethylotrophicum TaxID=1141884 RepID=UPI001436B231|nr:hypothetical protein [Methylobacterium nonmethylotrophicum]